MPRPRHRPVVNHALADHINQTRRTYADIAQTINEVSAEAGYPTRYGPGSLGHWLTGRTPLPPAVPAIAEAFARLLDRPVHARDLGWSGTGHEPPGDPWADDPLTWITRLERSTMLDRRTAITTTGLYSLTAITTPLPAASVLSRRGPARRAGPGDIARIQEMTRMFHHADDRHGGVHTCRALTAYLASDVVPLLRGSSGRTRPALFTAAARITYLAGWTCADAGANGPGQRYYIQAIRLAREAGDPTMEATALRALAVQALALGHTTHALHLAQAATDTLPAAAPPRARAWMHGMRAEAHAACGDTRAAMEALGQAERGVDQADSCPVRDQPGGYQREALEHQTGNTLARLRDLPAAEEHLRLSQTLRPADQRRARALIGARLALVQVHAREPESAAHTIIGLRHDLTRVTSARLDRELARLRSAWAPYRSTPLVAHADDLLVT